MKHGSICGAVLLTLSLAAVSHAQPFVGRPAPPVSVSRTIPSGARVDWKSLRGRPVVIEFWATWCGPCVMEIPHLNELAESTPNVKFISVAHDQGARVGAFLKKQPISGVVGIDEEGKTDKAYGVSYIPQTALIDANGVLRAMTLPQFVTPAVLADLAAGRRLDLPGRPISSIPESSGTPLYQVSILTADPDGTNASMWGTNRWEMRGMPLKNIVAAAWATPVSRISGPEELLAARYDVSVRLPRGMNDAAQLARGALVRAFSLKVHEESRPADILVLKAVAPKLRESAMVSGAGSKYGMGKASLVHTSISSVASWLETMLGRPMLDETGLSGFYDIELNWDPKIAGALEAAIGDQLGLELEQAQRPIEFLVIDSIELPTSN